jgi:hypothetical protein
VRLGLRPAFALRPFAFLSFGIPGMAASRHCPGHQVTGDRGWFVIRGIAASLNYPYPR